MTRPDDDRFAGIRLRERHIGWYVVALVALLVAAAFTFVPIVVGDTSTSVASGLHTYLHESPFLRLRLLAALAAVSWLAAVFFFVGPALFFRGTGLHLLGRLLLAAAITGGAWMWLSHNAAPDVNCRTHPDQRGCVQLPPGYPTPPTLLTPQTIPLPTTVPQTRG
jgi:hypothetical protein